MLQKLRWCRGANVCSSLFLALQNRFEDVSMLFSWLKIFKIKKSSVIPTKRVLPYPLIYVIGQGRIQKEKVGGAKIKVCLPQRQTFPLINYSSWSFPQCIRTHKCTCTYSTERLQDHTESKLDFFSSFFFIVS